MMYELGQELYVIMRYHEEDLYRVETWYYLDHEPSNYDPHGPKLRTDQERRFVLTREGLTFFFPCSDVFVTREEAEEKVRELRKR